jgi:hypothetical protein
MMLNALISQLCISGYVLLLSVRKSRIFLLVPAVGSSLKQFPLARKWPNYIS